jgi:hypothetical protein
VASLSGNSTNGIPNWDKYVKNQASLATVKYDLEKAAFLYKNVSNTKQSDVIGLLPVGTVVNIISPTQYKISVSKEAGKTSTNKPAAKVRYDGKSGYVLITAIRKPTKAPDSVEKRTIDITQTTLNAYKQVSGIGRGPKSGINIEVEGFGVIQNVATVSKVPQRVNNREAKADIVLKDTKGKPLLYVSHKAGGGAKAFQQYGGISKKAGTKANPGLIYNDPETQQYLSDLWKLYQDALAGAPDYGLANPFDEKGILKYGRIYRFVKSDDLIGKSVFGPDYGGAFGIDNVNLIGQGNFIFKPYMNDVQDISIRLNFENFEINGDISEFRKGDYRAIFISRSASDRKTETPFGNIPKLRSGIFNMSYLSGQSENIDALL